MSTTATTTKWGPKKNSYPAKELIGDLSDLVEFTRDADGDYEINNVEVEIAIDDDHETVLPYIVDLVAMPRDFDEEDDEHVLPTRRKRGNLPMFNVRFRLIGTRNRAVPQGDKYGDELVAVYEIEVM